MRRVGHKGADLIEPGNTLPSFDAALAHGVDMIELDVLPSSARLARGPPDPRARLRGRRRARAADARGRPLASRLGRLRRLDFIIDLKLPGLRGPRPRGARDGRPGGRAIISTTYRNSLARLREIDPSVRIALVGPPRPAGLHQVATAGGTGDGRASSDAADVCRARPPRPSRRSLRRGVRTLAPGRPALVEAVNPAGGELYVWTVDHSPRIRELQQLGVTGVITNDPRLFARSAAPRVAREPLRHRRTAETRRLSSAVRLRARGACACASASAWPRARPGARAPVGLGAFARRPSCVQAHLLEAQLEASAERLGRAAAPPGR